MTVNVDRILEDQLGDLAFTNPEVYAAIKHLYDIVRQERERSGGDEDSVARLAYITEAEDSKRFVEIRNLTKKVAALSLQVETQQSEINLLRNQLREKPREEVVFNLDRLEKRIKHLELQ